ncbi:MAG: putative zinc-binding protein [Planctomycetota bacterium]
MPGRCCGGNRSETLIFTCSGAAHTGQVAHRAGVQLMLEKEGQLFCIAAMAAGISDKCERARNAKVRVAIDGCEDACVKKILERAGLPVDVHVVATELGIEKQPKEPKIIEDTKRLASAVVEGLAPLRAW